MDAHRVTAFLAVMSLLVWSAVACSQPASDKPKFVVGDQWEFASTAVPTGKADTWSRTVVEVPGADRLRVKLQSGTIADYNGAMDWMPDGNPEFLRPLAAYPLSIGKEWSIERKFQNPNVSENGKAKVVAVEQITVPAGTFQCYRVEAKSSQGGRNNSIQRSWIRWYCPEVKWIAKETLETITFDRNSPAANGVVTETSELVRFTPGK